MFYDFNLTWHRNITQIFTGFRNVKQTKGEGRYEVVSSFDVPNIPESDTCVKYVMFRAHIQQTPATLLRKQEEARQNLLEEEPSRKDIGTVMAGVSGSNSEDAAKLHPSGKKAWYREDE
eukprot:g24077.t1